MVKNFKFLPSILALLFCLSGFAAFGQETTGEIQGTVKDPAGARVPGVTVNIKGIDVGFNRDITTDEEGYFRARQIPPGIYTVTAAATAGFTGQTKERVRVALGQATTVDFDVTVGGATADVTVTSDDAGLAVDPTDTKVQESITAREIDALPKGTNITSLLRTTAAARPEALSGGFQINGGSGSENSFIVDGQSVENFRTGVLNANNDIPFQSVQEVQVKSSGFEAEFGGATGGVVNIVTKSGTNEWRGEFGLNFSTPEFNAAARPILTNVATFDFSTPTSSQFVTSVYNGRGRGTNFFPTAQIGGPIVRDRAWFLAEYTPRIFNTTRTTTFIPSPLTGVVNSTQTASASETYEYARIRLDGSINDQLRLSSSFTYNPIVQRGLLLGNTTNFASPGFAEIGGSIGTLQGAELAALQGGRQNSNNFRIEGVYTPNSQLVTTVRYSRGFLNEKLGGYFVPEVGRFRVRQFTGQFNNTTGAAAAGVPLNFTNTNNNSGVVRDVSIRNQVNADASYLVSGFGGRHEFKGGYEYNKILNDVLRGYSQTGRIDLYYGRTTYPVGFGAFPTPPFQPAAGSRGVGVLLRFGTAGKAENLNQALYIQDKWQPTERLTLNLGMRIEKEDLPAFNGQQTNLKFGFMDKLAPRLGVAYALTGDGKTKVSAFYGRFYDRLKFELPRGSFGGDFYRVDYFDIPATGPLNYQSFNIARIIGNYPDSPGGSCSGTGIVSSGLTRCQFDYRIPSNVPEFAGLGGVDPNLKPFRQSEFTLEFQREVFTQSVFKSRYLYRNVDEAVEDAGFLTAEGSEAYIIGNPGRGLYAQRAQQFGFNRIATPQRRYDAFQVELDTRFVRNFNLNVNYTLSRLFGNYSGLANSDEDGRTSPGVNRNFDLPFVGFTASGQPDNGRLATDRPHVFKASGTYAYNWMGRNTNSTDLSFFTTAQSGTPQTTFVDIFGIFIPRTARGDLGRTEMLTQTDLNLTHRYRFGNENRFTMAFDFNVLNVFNENNVLLLDTNQSSAYYLLDSTEVAGNFVAATNILTSQGVLSQLDASVADFGQSDAINRTFGLPRSFQAPRSVRFGFRFQF
ncbi:MAG TPA: TonB-dependent receptor [Pyrinomonadaceae bacterium]|nr:TonB-dependent receptor [Pyrinomonadaceae bacterium]